jgi:hypothetical protein
MNFGRISTSKCRGMLQKMGCCTPNPPKKPRPLLHVRALKNYKKKIPKKNYKKTSVPPCLGGGPLVSARCGPRSPTRQLLTVQRSPGKGRPAVGDDWLGSSRPPPTSGRRLFLHGSPFLYSPCPLLPTSCPQNFAHVVNSSSLAPTHARPTQTSPKNFKHP